jgi:hypothetical protein
MAAQAQAAHNQAILQGLNAFTQLDVNTHRWDVSVCDLGSRPILTIDRTRRTTMT